MVNAKRLLVSVLLIAIAALSVLIGEACRKRGQTEHTESEMKPGTEPDEYSAAMVRTVLDGEHQQMTLTKEARSGELRRVEWSEGVQNLAIILRPDLGKSYLLDLDRQQYVESSLNSDNQTAGSDSQMKDRTNSDAASLIDQAVDRAIDDAPSPDHVETLSLSPSDIDGHFCNVREQRATFIDGHSEITKIFRAADLGELTLRTEAYSEPASVRIITERKNVTLSVAPGAFLVPSNFKRVDKLTR